MQRLFSFFPDRMPGAALLLLRVCTAGIVAFDTWQRLGTEASGWLVAPVVVLVLGLVAGGFTPLTALAGVVLELVFMCLEVRLLSGITCVQLVALGMLGPGAYSVDALRFGRRKLVWRPEGSADTRERNHR